MGTQTPGENWLIARLFKRVCATCYRLPTVLPSFFSSNRSHQSEELSNKPDIADVRQQWFCMLKHPANGFDRISSGPVAYSKWQLHRHRVTWCQSIPAFLGTFNRSSHFQEQNSRGSHLEPCRASTHSFSLISVNDVLTAILASILTKSRRYPSTLHLNHLPCHDSHHSNIGLSSQY